jgi:segregation and condensation protein B
MPSPADIVEALLFASEVPLEVERIREVLDLADAAQARALVEALRQRYAAEDRALAVAEVGGGFRMVTRSDVAPWLLKLAKTKTRARLSRPALETLAVIAYRQPVSRPEVDAIRGVNSEGVLDSLLERRLLRIAGRKEAPGRPFLYETTREFLVAFGLRDLADLPRVEGELVVAEPAPAGGDGQPVDGSGDAADAARAGSPVDPRETGDDTDTSALHGDAPAQQDPGAGGAGVAPGR